MEENKTFDPNTEETKDFERLYNAVLKEKENLKAANDRLSSENADWKRKERDRMTEEEKRRAEAEENARIAQKEHEELIQIRRERELYECGYSSDEVSEIMADGGSGKAYAKIMQSRIDKAIENTKMQLIKTNTTIPEGGAPKALTIDDYKKMPGGGMKELSKLAEENPEEYRRIIG